MTNRIKKTSKKPTQKETEQPDKDEIETIVEAPSIWGALTDQLFIQVLAFNELRPGSLNMESEGSVLLTTIRSDKALIDVEFNPSVPVIRYTIELDPNPVSTDKRKGKLTFGVEHGQVWLYRQRERLTMEAAAKYLLKMLM
jgi:hypothetical protein